MSGCWCCQLFTSRTLVSFYAVMLHWKDWQNLHLHSLFLLLPSQGCINSGDLLRVFTYSVIFSLFSFKKHWEGIGIREFKESQWSIPHILQWTLRGQPTRTVLCQVFTPALVESSTAVYLFCRDSWISSTHGGLTLLLFNYFKKTRFLRWLWIVC